MTRHLALIGAALLLGACATTFDLEGHRGTRGLRPENTLPAFARALEIGVDTLELDTNVTRDGVVIVMHDTRLNPDVARGPDGRWLEARGPAVHELTYAELSRYDVGRLKPGTRYAAGFPDQAAVDGTHAPRLADVFALVRASGDRKVRFNIETKISPLAPSEALPPEEFARRLVREIRDGGMARRSTIQSFDWRTLAVVQRIAPEIPTVYLTSQQKWSDTVCTGDAGGTPAIDPAACGESPWTAPVQLRKEGSVPRMVNAAGGSIWSPYYQDVDAAKLKEAHDLGISVVVWTVNDPAQMKRLVEMGVDGLITDRPDVFREALGRP
ncbi:MAG TPA: glycerophosphodiester phosphodiesterase [Usitatibacter sp.]|nr:glycerophosphodiester phosphodiesterase [Usitatibacter sp.]